MPPCLWLRLSPCGGVRMVQKNAIPLRTSNALPAAVATVPLVEIHYSFPRLHFPDRLTSSESCHAPIRSLYDPHKIAHKEFFYLVLLNNSLRCIGYALIGIGTTGSVAVNIKEILQLALLSNATHIILSHNHPSGSTKPSPDDIALTKRVKKAAALFDVKLADHIIITPETYVSLADEGLL